MNPNVANTLAGFRTILGYVALALACIALAKLFGASVNGIPGSVEQLALVAIACKMA
jgi:hypothetical protein